MKILGKITYLLRIYTYFYRYFSSTQLDVQYSEISINIRERIEANARNHNRRENVTNAIIETKFDKNSKGDIQILLSFWGDKIFRHKIGSFML